MKRMISFLAIGALALTSCGQKDPQNGGNFSIGGHVGEQAPAVSLTDLDGETLTLDSLAGEIVILSVWSEICAECLGVEGDLNEIEKLSTQYAQNGQGVSVFAPNFIDPVWRIHELKEEGDYRVAILYDPDKTFAEAFEISELPVMLVFVIDRSGIIRYRQSGVDLDSIEEVITSIPD